MEAAKSNILPPILILSLAVGIALWRLGQVPLYNTEAFYAETAREMLESDDRLTPRFDYDRFLDKPPLYYWSLLPTYRLLGTTERAARLPAALALAGCVGLTILIGTRLFDRKTGCLAGLFLATTMGFYVYSHAVLVEPLLTFWIMASLLSFWSYYRNQARKAWLWMMYACWALGVLTKGLTALVFPVAIIAAFLLLIGGSRNLKPLLSWPGWLLFLGLSLPWYCWIALHHRGYLWFYFVHEQFLRFLDLRMIKDPRLPTPVFVGLLVPFLFPWSFFMPQSILFHLRQWRGSKGSHEASLFVLLWATVILGFFCFSKFKLDYYSLPAWPAIVLAVAHFLESRRKQQDSASLLSLWIPVGCMLLGSAIGLLLISRAVKFYQLELPHPWFLEGTRRALGLFLCATLAATSLFLLQRVKAALLCLAFMMLPIMSLAQQGMFLLGPYFSNKDLSQVAGRCLRSLSTPAALVQGESDEDIYVGGDVFYTRRKVWLVIPSEKQLFPMGRKFYLTPQELVSWWRRGEPVLLLEDAVRVSKLLGKNSSYLLAGSGGKVLVSNRAVCGASTLNTQVTLLGRAP